MSEKQLNTMHGEGDSAIDFKGVRYVMLVKIFAMVGVVNKTPEGLVAKDILREKALIKKYI